jgi:hypothetical protein
MFRNIFSYKCCSLQILKFRAPSNFRICLNYRFIILLENLKPATILNPICVSRKTNMSCNCKIGHSVIFKLSSFFNILKYLPFSNV